MSSPRIPVPSSSSIISNPQIKKLLGSVVCTPSTAVVGESVRVEVRGPDGVAHDNRETVPISINGSLGSTQYLTWDFAGKHAITVIAHRRGAMEKLTATIELKKRADGKRPASLQVRWQPDEPTEARFTVLNPPQMKWQGKPSRLSEAQVQASSFITLRTRPYVRMNPRSPKARRPRIKLPGVGGLTGGGTLPTIYEWDFGDGVKLSTVLPSFSHDYGPKLDAQHLHQMFHVSVTVRAPGENPVVLRRTITVNNPYVLMKRRGVLQPFIADTRLSAHFSPAPAASQRGYRTEITVRNPESFDLTLTRRRIERIYGDEKRYSEMLAEENVNVVLKANGTTRIPIFVAKNLLPKRIIGFVAHYIGKAPNGKPVRVTGYFDLPEHLTKRYAIKPELLKEIEKLANRGVLSDPKMISRKELNQLEYQGLIAPGLLSNLTGGAVMMAMSHKEPPKAVEGEDCDPWNLPDVVPDGMFCMPTQKTEKVLMPPRFMNARKGDIILSPGDGGLISDVLGAVTPPQSFSHSGIMTRNLDEITHSTAAEKRIMDDDFVGSDGIRPDVLKYLWPGVITQDIEQAVRGQVMVDPENGKPYTVSGFSSELGQIGSPEVVTPMVVKPDPLTETAAIRDKLHAIADFAAQQEGKSHYRFFCYTDPTIGLTSSAPNEAKWAAGTFPSVCSSLIWKAIKSAGVQMEGALEPADLDGGAQIAEDTPDGLYVYDADERLAAGEVLFNRLHGLVMMKAGSWGDALTDVADDISNQILNTFASDWADEDAKDSEKWRDTVDANAVSPLNLMFYDSPFYGFSEPLIFRDWRVEEVVVHKWKKVTQTGTLKGVVRFKGKPAKGAHVQISETQFTASKDDGSFEITGAPAGPVLIDTQKPQDNMLLTAKVKADVAANKTTSVKIDLQAPSHLFRRIRIEGSMLTVDYEFAAAAYPQWRSDIEGIIDLDPGTATHKVKTFDAPCDDAVGRLYVTCDLQSDDSVKVKVKIRCYNTDDPSDDPEDYSQAEIDSFVVKPDKSWSGWISTDDDNYASAQFTVTNRTNQS